MKTDAEIMTISKILNGTNYNFHNPFFAACFNAVVISIFFFELSSFFNIIIERLKSYPAKLYDAIV